MHRDNYVLTYPLILSAIKASYNYVLDLEIIYDMNGVIFYNALNLHNIKQFKCIAISIEFSSSKAKQNRFTILNEWTK